MCQKNRNKNIEDLDQGGGWPHGKLNVAVADDNERMVEVLGKIIEEDKDLELVGKAIMEKKSVIL